VVGKKKKIFANENKRKKIVQRGKAKKNIFKIPEKNPF
jgi:hypothetical protein